MQGVIRGIGIADGAGQCPRVIMLSPGEKRYSSGLTCLPCVWCGACNPLREA